MVDDPDWLEQHVPQQKALEDAGFDVLAANMKRFQAEDTVGGEPPSGRTGLAEALGWSLAEAKRGPRLDAEQANYNGTLCY